MRAIAPGSAAGLKVAAAEKHRRGVAKARGLQAVERFNKIRVRFLQRQGEVVFALGNVRVRVYCSKQMFV